MSTSKLPPAGPDPVPLTRTEVKAAVAEALRDNREWFREMVQDALESAAHDEARREAEYLATRQDPRRAFPSVEGRA